MSLSHGLPMAYRTDFTWLTSHRPCGCGNERPISGQSSPPCEGLRPGRGGSLAGTEAAPGPGRTVTTRVLARATGDPGRLGLNIRGLRGKLHSGRGARFGVTITISRGADRRTSGIPSAPMVRRRIRLACRCCGRGHQHGPPPQSRGGGDCRRLQPIGHCGQVRCDDRYTPLVSVSCRPSELTTTCT